MNAKWVIAIIVLILGTVLMLSLMSNKSGSRKFQNERLIPINDKAELLIRWNE